MPEQIMAYGIRPTTAALVDVWGRPHRVDLKTHVGRVVDGPTLCIFTPTVSRAHAAVAREDDAWLVSDLASRKGTFVDNRRVGERQILRDGAVVRIGDVAFFFVWDAPRRSRLSRGSGETVRLPPESEATRATVELTAQPAPEVIFELHQPTGGGGAVATIDGKTIQLTIAQHDLIEALIERSLAEKTVDDDNRGFVSIDELLLTLSFESTAAASDNVRQLVRRVRRLLEAAGLDDIIESRPGRGYRLRVVPRLK